MTHTLLLELLSQASQSFSLQQVVPAQEVMPGGQSTDVPPHSIACRDRHCHTSSSSS